jgi:hypothetical protein
MDAAAKLRRRAPIWRRVAQVFGWSRPLRKWLERWEKRNTAALKAAVKKGSHHLAKGYMAELQGDKKKAVRHYSKVKP